MAGGSYEYDANGNMTNAGHASGIAYNFLNLPMQASADTPEGGNGVHKYLYDAGGTKLRSTVDGTNKEGETIKYIQDYVGGIEYKDQKLAAIYHAEGRICFDEETGGERAEWCLKDHLGNTRVTFSDIDGDGNIEVVDDTLTTDVYEREISQENHYYPFGMARQDCSLDTLKENKYLYNGKELDTDFGLNWYHYGARMYDPAIGRFTGVDPISDQFAWVSTYNYAENEPIAHIDLHGLQKSKPNPAKGVEHEWQPDDAEMVARGRYPTQNDVLTSRSGVNFSNPNEVTQFEADKRITRRNRVWKWFETAIEGVGALDIIPDIGALFASARRAVHFGSSFSRTLFDGVNDIGTEVACGPTAVACDLRMGGDASVKASEVVGSLGKTRDWFNYRGVPDDGRIARLYNTREISFNSIDELSTYLKNQGNGSRGIILGQNVNGTKGHVWNAYIDDTGTFRQLDKARDLTRTLRDRTNNLRLVQTN